MKTDWKCLAYDKDDDKDTYVRKQLSIDVGELIYGLGEHFTPFAKNGQSVGKNIYQVKGFSYALPLQKCNLYFTDRYSYDVKYGS